MIDWAQAVCEVAMRWRDGGESIRQLFESAHAHLAQREQFLAAIRHRLRVEPGLVDAWISFSEDQRSVPAPYVERTAAPSLEVGWYEGGRRDIARHAEDAEACADYIYREAAWVLEGRRVTARQADSRQAVRRSLHLSAAG